MDCSRMKASWLSLVLVGAMVFSACSSSDEEASALSALPELDAGGERGGAVDAGTVEADGVAHDAPSDVPPVVTWKVLAMIFARAEHGGVSTEMTPIELERAREAVSGFEREVKRISNGAMAVDVTVVEPVEPLTSFQELAVAGRNGVSPTSVAMQPIVAQYPSVDSHIVIWKHGSVIPYGWGGLTTPAAKNRPGHSDCPVDTMNYEANRPYEAIVHEWGHQMEFFYCGENLMDRCGDFEQSRCSEDAEYPDDSWMCCYRSIYSASIPQAECLSPKNLAKLGTPTNPKGN